MAEVITSRQNARVKELRAALHGHPAEGFAAVEGWNQIEAAVEASVVVGAVYLREDTVNRLRSTGAGVDTVRLSADVFDSVAQTEQPQGVAALLRKPRHSYTPAAGDLVVVAAGLQDPGNLGTIIRSAEALGAAAVLLAEQTVDPWNGKAMRASAGSVLRLPLLRWSDALLDGMRGQGIRLLAAVPRGEGAIPAHEADLRTGCALLIGNEGSGLSAAMLSVADGHVTLPMMGRAESLNAAVAASLLLYEAARQRGMGARESGSGG